MSSIQGNMAIYSYIIPYKWKISLDKNFAKSSYLCITELFDGAKFHQRSKSRHILYVIIN